MNIDERLNEIENLIKENEIIKAGDLIDDLEYYITYFASVSMTRKQQKRKMSLEHKLFETFKK